MQSVGQRIKQRRKELNMSVDELAERLGKNRATVYRYESDDIENLPTTVLEPLARALNTTPAFLMGWIDDSRISLRTVIANAINLQESVSTKLDENVERLISYYDCLNTTGKKKLLERAEELTYIEMYKNEKPNYLQPVAAHERTDIEHTEEGKKHDDDLMNDESIWDD